MRSAPAASWPPKKDCSSAYRPERRRRRRRNSLCGPKIKGKTSSSCCRTPANATCRPYSTHSTNIRCKTRLTPALARSSKKDSAAVPSGTAAESSFSRQYYALLPFSKFRTESIKKATTAVRAVASPPSAKIAAIPTWSARNPAASRPKTEGNRLMLSNSKNTRPITDASIRFCNKAVKGLRPAFPRRTGSRSDSPDTACPKIPSASSAAAMPQSRQMKAPPRNRFSN